MLEKGDTVIAGEAGGRRLELRLRRFQERVLDFFLGDKRSLLLRAPTGSGKTLTIILPLAARIIGGREYYGVLAVYPTKALVEDQYESVKRLLLGLGDTVAEEANYLVVDAALEIRRCGARYSGRHRVALVKLTRESLDALAERLGAEGSRRLLLEELVEQLAGVHGVDYVAAFAVPEYPYLLVSRLYSNPRAWKLLDKAATGEAMDLLRLYLEGGEAEAHRRAKQLMGGAYLGKVLYDILASLGNVLFLDEFHVWRGFERPTVEALVDAMDTVARIHMVDLRFVFSSATPVRLAEVEPEEVVEASPSRSGDVIRGNTRIIIVPVPVKGGGTVAWMQVDSSLPDVVAKLAEWLSRCIRFMVIGRRNYNVEEAARRYYEATGEKPVVVTGVEPPPWARGREELPRLKERGRLPLFGNFAVELGIDLADIRCGVVTAATHGELVQRMGRIGRGSVDSTIVIPVPQHYAQQLAGKLREARSYEEAIQALRGFLEERLQIEEGYEKSHALRTINKARKLIPLTLVALSLIASDKYRDTTYRRALERYRERLEALRKEAGAWLAARAARTPASLIALASFRTGLQVKYRRGGIEDTASLSTLLTNYQLRLENGELVVEEARRSRPREELRLLSKLHEEKWRTLYGALLPAHTLAGIASFEPATGASNILAELLRSLDAPVYVAPPDEPYMELLSAYGQAIPVDPATGAGRLAYLIPL